MRGKSCKTGCLPCTEINDDLGPVIIGLAEPVTREYPPRYSLSDLRTASLLLS